MIRNKTAEKDIRDYLTTMGYYGQSARFGELELHAVGRPGWVQVFRFQVEIKKQNGQWDSLFGALRDDDRTKSCEIVLTNTLGEQEHQLATWSNGLIVSKRRHGDASLPNAGIWRQLAIVLLAITATLAALSWFIGQE